MNTKTAYVHRVFTAIADRYDLLNTLLSFNLDQQWRRATVSALELRGGEAVLDVATGTGKLAQEVKRRTGQTGMVTGIDFCKPMLLKARNQTTDTNLVLAASDHLPFPDNAFDGATIGFALRNVPDIERTLRETTRVIKPRGRVVCLEFSRPQHRIARWLHEFYLLRILPTAGRLISGDRDAYLYLPRSIMEFPKPEEIRETMARAGLTRVHFRLLHWGVVAVYVGTKQ